MDTGGIAEGLGEDKPRTTDEVLKDVAKDFESGKPDKKTGDADHSDTED